MSARKGSSDTIRAVGFDLWETLITNTPELSRKQQTLRLDRLAAVLHYLEADCEAGTLAAAYKASWQRCQELYWSRDVDIPTQRQIEHLLESAGISHETFDVSAFERLDEAYCSPARDVLPALVEGAAETLSALRRDGFRVGLVSNTGRTPGSSLRVILEKLGLAEHVDVAIFSNEHGECKPRASIFERLGRDLGLASREIAFVGDNLYADVFGAKSAGMRAVHFLPPRKGTAVAPAGVREKTIEPDAVITALVELPGLVARWSS